MGEGVGSRYMDPQLVIKNRGSPKKGPARFPDGRSSGVRGEKAHLSPCNSARE